MCLSSDLAWLSLHGKMQFAMNKVLCKFSFNIPFFCASSKSIWYNYLQIANYCLYMYWTLTCNMRQWLAILCPHSFKTARHLLLVMQPFGVIYHERIFYTCTFPKKMQWLTESQSVWHTHGAWRHGKVRDNTYNRFSVFWLAVFSIFSWYRIFFIFSYQLFILSDLINCMYVFIEFIVHWSLFPRITCKDCCYTSPDRTWDKHLKCSKILPTKLF